MSFGLTANGPEKEFDNIYERGRAAASLEQIECNVFRSGYLTCYRMAIPWRVLNMKPAAGTVFGLNFIANDHDGHGRNYWMGLTPGIGEAKNHTSTGNSSSGSDGGTPDDIPLMPPAFSTRIPGRHSAVPQREIV